MLTDPLTGELPGKADGNTWLCVASKSALVRNCEGKLCEGTEWGLQWRVKWTGAEYKLDVNKDHQFCFDWKTVITIGQIGSWSAWSAWQLLSPGGMRCHGKCGQTQSPCWQSDQIISSMITVMPQVVLSSSRSQGRVPMYEHGSAVPVLPGKYK